MKDSNILLEKENLFSKNVENVIVQYKNDLIIKTINLYLTANYREAEMVLLTEFPENSFNDDSMVQYIMGHIKLKLEEYEAALNYFCHALNNEIGQTSLIYDSRGLTYIKQHDYEGAIRNFKEACSYSQNNFHFHNHLAICYKIIYTIQQNKDEKIINLSRSKSESENDNLSKSRSMNSSNLESIDEKENEKKKSKESKKSKKKLIIIIKC